MVKMHSKAHTINGREFADDVRSGMTDLELSNKFDLTVSDFDRVLEYLVDAELITMGELLELQHLSDSQILRAFVESSEDIRLAV